MGNFKVKDHYFHKAKQENYVARSIYKLEEIDQKYKVLRPGNLVVDFGYYPGSWIQYTSKVIGKDGRVVGIDIQEVNKKLTGIPNVRIYQKDIFNISDLAQLDVGDQFDVVLSDMAPSTTGIKSVDQARSLNLVESVFGLLPKFLKPGGNFVIKVFDSQDAQNYLKEQKNQFIEYHYLKPKSTRSVSKEFLSLERTLRHNALMVFKDLNRFSFLATLGLFCALPAWANLNFIKDNTLFTTPADIQVKTTPSETNEEWKKIVGKHQTWNEIIDYDSSKYKPNYTFNSNLEDFIKKQLALYHPDYTSVVVMDNETGHILAAVDYARAKNLYGRDLAFTTTHPAASVFKVITAADLLENTHIKTDTEFHFTGRSTTLYKSQLKEPASRRWIRSLDLQKAFATSNNVIFGRTAIENLTPAGLMKMAEKFGFNKKLLEGINLTPSVFKMAQDQYNLAEFSSGLNTQTVISPVHGAVISSIVANGGMLRYPVVIKSLESTENKKVIFPPLKKDEQVLTPQSAEDLRTLFMSTVVQGTARSSFRRSKYLLNKLEIGGKTGSITGGEPYGKRDWFVSYAKLLEDKNDKGISICVMIVNQKKWYIKSPLLAKNIMEYYYSTLYPLKSKKAFCMQENQNPEVVVTPVEETPVVAGTSRKEKFIKEVKSFTFIILSVLIFRSVLFEPFKIPSGSMIPTLLIGDFILVNKFAYGFKVPFSDWFTDPIYVTGPKQPERGDVIVFKYPKDTNLNYIKRVIGLPGDTIEVVDKVVYVNNKPIETREVDGKKILEDMDDRYKSYQFKFMETKTGHATHITQVDQGNDYFANYYKFTVPKDNFFVMGDNRDFSADSRRWGTVPFGHIKGKAIMIWFSLSVPWPGSEDEQESFKFRPWRIGTIID